MNPVVRETTCKTILNRGGIGDYSLNCYGGCVHACVYCYARFMQRFHEHPEPWGAFVDVKTNAVEVLERQLAKQIPGSVFVSSACDGWQPLEARYQLTRSCCALLFQHGFQVNALTKNVLIERDFDLFQQYKGRIGITITTLIQALADLWEPHASLVEARWRVLEHARQAGIRTTVMFGPLLPFLYDDQKAVDALFERAASINIDRILVDVMNPRPKVWDSVSMLLEAAYPGLRERYARILYSEPVRKAYCKAVYDRVRRAAARFHLEKQLCGCTHPPSNGIVEPG